MDRSVVLGAIRSGKPFLIRMADGREYSIPTPDHIAMNPKGTFVQVFNDEDAVVSLPLIVMTGVEYTVDHGNGESSTGNN